MSGFSNFELECNLQAKSNELGNFLIDTTENIQFTTNCGAANFLTSNIIPAIAYPTDEYYSSYQNYNNINQSSVYPIFNNNNTTMLYYPSSSTSMDHHTIPKNYPNFNNVISASNLTYLTNNYGIPPQPITVPGSIYNQRNQIYGIKSMQHQPIHNQQHQQISNLMNASNSNVTLLTAQVPRTVKEFNKNYYQPKKHFPNDKKQMKFNKHNLVKDKPTTDLSPIVVSLEKLRIGPDYPNPSELFTILSLFRQLSHYTMQMCKERRSLETLFLSNITGYIPDSNYLPAVIKDISSHIKLTKQSISHEFYEIQKLIGSIKILQYGNINELNDKFQLEILNLEKYEYIHIKHKNGMLLLSNDKIVGLKNILINIIEYVRMYTVYVTTLKYKITKERNIILATTASTGSGYRSLGRQEVRRIGV